MTAKRSEQHTGADEMVACLAAQAVETIFCITGAGNLALVDAISRNRTINLVFCHHEQAVVMAAQGYARVSGKVGVALVTTGGGAANALTGALSANLDSIPILLISGNESSFHFEGMAGLRALGVQGFDAVAVFAPVTKYAERINRTSDIRTHFFQAWATADSNRRGVALLDFPMDLQRAPLPEIETTVMLSTPSSPTPTPSSELIASCARALASARQPLLYLGNGARNAEAHEAALELIHSRDLPFMLSWSAADLIEDSHPLNVGRIGIYGDRASNILLQRSDVLVCVGTRLAIPQTGYDKDDFARTAERWVVDVDPLELSKFGGPRWNVIESDAGLFFRKLIEELRSVPVQPHDDWLTECKRVWAALPREAQTGDRSVSGTGSIHSSRVVEFLNDALADDAIVVTDVGAGLLSGHYSLRPRPKQRVFTSQGLGEMGFGLPAAIGAHFADPTRQIVCLSTDGGMMFNLQELETARTNAIPLKLFVFNNNGYSMIRISQENLFAARYAGIDAESGIGFPDFSLVAKTFGFTHYLVEDETSLSDSVVTALDAPEASLVEVRMSPSQKYLPRLGTRKLPDGSLVSPPLEDLDPLIPIEQLEDLLASRPHPRSFALRGLHNA